MYYTSWGIIIDDIVFPNNGDCHLHILIRIRGHGTVEHIHGLLRHGIDLSHNGRHA